LKNGEGIPKNELQGLELQKRAVQGLQEMGDNPYALSSLGVILFQGKVLPEDKLGASSLYKKAASLGYAPAALNLARWPEHYTGEPSEQERIALLKQASGAGLSTAQMLLAEKGIKDSEVEAQAPNGEKKGEVNIINNNFHEGYVNSASFVKSDEILATASGDGSIKIWNLPSNRLIRTIHTPAPAGVITFNPDKDELFVSGGQNKSFSYAAIYDAKTGKLKYPYLKILNWSCEEWPIAYDSARKTILLVRRDGVYQHQCQEWENSDIDVSNPKEISVEKIISEKLLISRLNRFLNFHALFL